MFVPFFRLVDRMSRLYPIFQVLGHHILKVIKALIMWRMRSLVRVELMSLSDHQLKDIGLTRADVWSENGPLFWRDTDPDDRHTR